MTLGISWGLLLECWSFNKNSFQRAKANVVLGILSTELAMYQLTNPLIKALLIGEQGAHRPSLLFSREFAQFCSLHFTLIGICFFCSILAHMIHRCSTVALYVSKQATCGVRLLCLCLLVQKPFQAHLVPICLPDRETRQKRPQSHSLLFPGRDSAKADKATSPRKFWRNPAVKLSMRIL